MPAGDSLHVTQMDGFVPPKAEPSPQHVRSMTVTERVFEPAPDKTGKSTAKQSASVAAPAEQEK